jgi:hypothetical protein
VTNISSGDIIEGPRWPEPIEVKLIEEVAGGAYYRVVGATRNSHTHVDQLVPREEITQLQ